MKYSSLRRTLDDFESDKTIKIVVEQPADCTKVVSWNSISAPSAVRHCTLCRRRRLLLGGLAR
jgi:hypothetical protein